MNNLINKIEFKDGKYVCIVEDIRFKILESGKIQLDLIVILKNKEKALIRYDISKKNRKFMLKALSNAFENKEKDISNNISDSELKEKLEMLKHKFRILTVKTKVKNNGQVYKQSLLGFM